MNDERPSEVILEEVRGQYRTLKEGLDNLQSLPEVVDEIKADVAELKADMRAVKLVVPSQRRYYRT